MFYRAIEFLISTYRVLDSVLLICKDPCSLMSIYPRKASLRLMTDYEAQNVATKLVESVRRPANAPKPSMGFTKTYGALKTS